MKRYIFAFLFIFSILSLAVFADDNISIIAQPEDQTVVVGELAVFTCVATGPSNMTYQWQYNDGVNGWLNYVGETASELSFVATSSLNGYQYRCKVRKGTSSTGQVYSDVVSLTVTEYPFTNGLWYSVLGQNNFAYIEKLNSSNSYDNISSYVGYREVSTNGLSVFYNTGLNVFWQAGSGTYYPLLISIPFNMGQMASDDHYHFQFAFSSSLLSAIPINYTVLAGSAVNKANHTATNSCSVTYSSTLSSVDIGSEEWNFFNIDVRQLNSSSRFDYLYIFLFLNYGVSSSNAGTFSFGFTSNSSYGVSDLDSITTNILEISANLSEIQSVLSDLNFNVDVVNSNVVLIYNLLRNSNTQSLVQQITNQVGQIITPTQEWVDIVEELNEKFEDQESTLSDLGDILESLDKPTVEDFVPSSTDVLSSDYVDMSLVSDVFSPVFEDQTIIWLLLAAIGLVTISFVLFGKKS